jgi:PAS domain S-box-containing protein
VLWIRNADSLQWEYLSPAFEEVYGENRERALEGDNLRNWIERILPEDRDHVLDSLNQVRAGERVTFEFRIIRPDGQLRWMRDTDFPLLDETGRVQRIGGIGQDITERKEAEEALRASEERAKLLLGELQHRVRNTLSVIRSITRRTAETSQSVEDYAMHLDGRINAFARVQTAVARDPAAGLDLTDLVADELLTYVAHDGEQVRIAGPAVRLKPKAAETFGLAVHELATNAVKHGALSSPDGRIRVTWRVHNGTDPPRLVFEWKESGTPNRTPRRKRRGFGTDLLERTLTYELKAKTVQTFEPDGLRCTIELPMTERLVRGDSANMLQQD